MTLTEVPMHEHTDISGPAIIVRLLAHAGEGVGADKPRYFLVVEQQPDFIVDMQ